VRVRRRSLVCTVCGSGRAPRDEDRALGPGAESATLRAGMSRHATGMPCAHAAAPLAFFWGVTVSTATVRRQTAAAAAYVAVQTAAGERLGRAQPPPPAGPAPQQVSADGAMAPLVGGEWAAVKTVARGTIERDATVSERERRRAPSGYAHFPAARRWGMRGPRVVTPAAITTPPSATHRVIPTTGVPQLPPLRAATTHPWRHRLLAKKAVTSRSRI